MTRRKICRYPLAPGNYHDIKALYELNAAAKEDSMKTMFRSVALFSLLISLFGCSSSHDASSTSSPPGSAAYTANDAGTSVSVAVPTGAYDTAKAQPKFTVTKNLAALPAGNPITAGGGTVGDVFVITTDYTDDFMQPVVVTVPYNPASNAMPSVVYYDSANSAYVPVDILEIGANTVTFSTVHFSTYATAGHSGMNSASIDLTAFTVDSGFVPGVDGFDVANFGNFVAPDSSGLAMANFATWYYNYKKVLKGLPQLYNKYSTTVEKALISSIQSSTTNIWQNFWNSSASKLSNRQVGLLMLQNMKLTNSPQIFILKSFDANNKANFAHVTMAYKFVPSSADGGTFYLYDPNFPNEAVTINFSLINGFTGYSKAGAFSQTFTKYTFSSSSNIGSYRQFEAAFQAAETPLGTISLTAPTLNSADVASIPVTSAALPNVTVTGTVSGTTAMKEMFYSLNGGTAVSLGSAAGFNFTLTGSALTNPSTVTIYGLSNTANPWSVVAYRQITLNFTGTTISSFGNLGFESADMTSWLVETRLDSQIVPTASTLYADTSKSPFARISATTVSPWGSTGYSGCPGGKPSDGKGYCYDANGAVNPDYDQYWGLLTAFNGAAYTPAKSIVVQRSDTDQYVGTLFPLVNNGNYSLRVNNYDPSDHVSTTTQTATIPAVALPTLKFAWAAVLEDAGHSLYDNPFVQVLVKDITANKILYYKRFANNDPTYSGWIISPISGWSLIPWQTVSLDVSNSKGNQVMISVTGGDCAQGGHGGYVYLDDSP